ncbi:MAG: hypothetical protein FJ096_19435 [Deltaproteobacteria bacterium]|nr:hypothetical protein [Deltaproteobacteria bacterium]
MQFPRLDPLPPLLPEAAPRAKSEDRSSVAEAATAAQLEPVGSRARDRGRDPTLDPTRQRRERGDLTEDERRRRESQRPPSESPEADFPDHATVDAIERAALGAPATGLTPSTDLTARALDLIHEWGRERIQSGDLDVRALPLDSPLAPRSATPVDPALASLRRLALRAYKRG